MTMCVRTYQYAHPKCLHFIILFRFICLLFFSVMASKLFELRMMDMIPE